MDIYVYSDESGVFDRHHNDYFVFGGLVAFSYSEADEATRRYQHAEKLIKTTTVQNGFVHQKIVC